MTTLEVSTSIEGNEQGLLSTTAGQVLVPRDPDQDGSQIKLKVRSTSDCIRLVFKTSI